MNKGEFIKSIAQKTGTTDKQADAFYVAFVATVEEALSKEEKIQLVGFGGFELKTKPAREGINPRTKEKVSIPESKVPVFKAGAAFKSQFNK